MIPFKIRTKKYIFLFTTLTLTSFVTRLDFVADKPKLE